MATDATYKTEMVSPICTYEDIPTIQELVRQLRHKGAFSNTSCGIHIHVETAAFNARTLRNLVNIFYSKEDLLFSALQVRESRWGYCKPMDERFLQELNRKRPQTMRAFQKIWYGGEDGSNTHYHDSRYHALNLHSVFSHGTVEFRLFNSTHPAVPCHLRPGAEPAGRQPHQDSDHKPGLHLPHLAAALGYDWG